MADIFDEVTEELRQDQFKEIWKRYQKFIFLSLFLIISIVGGYKGYQYYKNQKILDNSKLFFNALSKIDNNKLADAEKLLLQLESNENTGYYLFSMFALAKLNMEKGNYLLMEKYYTSIINNKSFEKFYRDLALIYLTINSKKISNDDKIKRLKPIITSPNKLQSFAAEMEILYLFDSNKNKIANKKLNDLINRSDIQNNQKNRLNIIKEIFTK